METKDLHNYKIISKYLFFYVILRGFGIFLFYIKVLLELSRGYLMYLCRI